MFYTAGMSTSSPPGTNQGPSTPPSVAARSAAASAWAATPLPAPKRPVRRRSAAGRKATLTTEAIVAAAIEVLDEGGVAGLSMRLHMLMKDMEAMTLHSATQRVIGYLSLPSRPGDGAPMPQDVKLSPDGKVFYVADMMSNGVWLINGVTMKIIGFRHTGAGAHGLYVSRDSKYLYVTNRGEGSISLINLSSRKVARKWRIGGSPDMGGVSADGKVLWLSGRYNADVYAISTRTGHLIAKIPVGSGPHGLCVFPQPGRYSLGHTGVFR